MRVLVLVAVLLLWTTWGLAVWPVFPTQLKTQTLWTWTAMLGTLSLHTVLLILLVFRGRA